MACVPCGTLLDAECARHPVDRLPCLSVYASPLSERTLPQGLALGEGGSGVVATRPFSAGACLGWVGGKMVGSQSQSPHGWCLVGTNGFPYCYMDPRNPAISNWAHFLRPSAVGQRVNLFGVQQGQKVSVASLLFSLFVPQSGRAYSETNIIPSSFEPESPAYYFNLIF